MFPIGLISIWVLILKIFKKRELYFFYFLVGSVGLFSILLYGGNKEVQYQLIGLIAQIMFKIAPYTGFIEVFPKYGMLNVKQLPQCISFFIDYECSGFVEMLVFMSLTWFYPIYSIVQRVLLSIGGAIYIIVANVLRILMICFWIKSFGSDSIFIAHAIMGRLVFFVLVLLLYFNVFTKPHILFQKVGGING